MGVRWAWGPTGSQTAAGEHAPPPYLPPSLGVLFPNMAIVSAGNFSVKRSRGLVDSLVSVAATKICHCGVSVTTPCGSVLCSSRTSFVEQAACGAGTLWFASPCSGHLLVVELSVDRWKPPGVV